MVLSRRLYETIQIGENIFISVVDIERGKVRIGVTAPRDVPIMRSELLKPGETPATTPYRRPDAELAAEEDRLQDKVAARHGE